MIGDGAMTGGMAYEALNNAGAMHNKLIVILNDNDMSIAPPVGALSAYLSRLISSKSYRSLRDIGLHMSEKFPRPIKKAAQRAEEYARGMLTRAGRCSRSSVFSMSGRSTGTIWNILIPVLKNVRDDEAEGPVLVHVVTQKGKGYEPARTVGRQISRRRQVRRRHRCARQGQGQCAELYQGLRPEPDPGSARRRQDRRHHRGHAVGHRHRPVRTGIPHPHVRCGTCRTARYHICRRPRR